jgi:hypothetical protein
MFVFGGMILGALIGGFTARRRGGRPLDIAQYAAVFAIIFAVLGVILTVAVNRLFARG